MKEHQENENSPLELAVLAGKILLSNGAEIFRVQETMERIAASYHMDTFHVYAISNGIFACGTENGVAHTAEIRHVPLSPVHLGRVAAVNQLSREIAEGRHTVPEARAILEGIQKSPEKKNLFRVLASGVGSGAFCVLFGGTAGDALAALLTGLLLYLVILYPLRRPMSKIVQNLLCGAFVAGCAVGLTRLGLGENLDAVIGGSIVPLVPGLAFITGIRDIGNQDYISGSVRMLDALLTIFSVALGVGLTISFLHRLVGGIL